MMIGSIKTCIWKVIIKVTSEGTWVLFNL